MRVALLAALALASACACQKSPAESRATDIVKAQKPAGLCVRQLSSAERFADKVAQAAVPDETAKPKLERAMLVTWVACLSACQSIGGEDGVACDAAISDIYGLRAETQKQKGPPAPGVAAGWRDRMAKAGPAFVKVFNAVAEKNGVKVLSYPPKEEVSSAPE
jgi:hypothetical protein